MNARHRMLTRLREVLEESGTPPLDLPVEGPSPSPAPEAGELARRFRIEAEAQDVAVLEAEDPDRAARLLGDLLERLEVQTAVIDRDGLTTHPAVQAALRERGVRDLTPPPAGPEDTPDREAFKSAAARADVGITGVDYALADTGTLVLCSAPGRSRSTSLLPPVHLALVPASRILPFLPDLPNRLPGDDGAREGASAVTLITGTSKTADIELSLVRGVHGPGEVYVILLPGPDM